MLFRFAVGSAALTMLATLGVIAWNSWLVLTNPRGVFFGDAPSFVTAYTLSMLAFCLVHHVVAISIASLTDVRRGMLVAAWMLSGSALFLALSELIADVSMTYLMNLVPSTSPGSLGGPTASTLHSEHEVQSIFVPAVFTSRTVAETISVIGLAVGWIVLTMSSQRQRTTE